MSFVCKSEALEMEITTVNANERERERSRDVSGIWRAEAVAIGY